MVGHGMLEGIAATKFGRIAADSLPACCIERGAARQEYWRTKRLIKTMPIALEVDQREPRAMVRGVSLLRQGSNHRAVNYPAMGVRRTAGPWNRRRRSSKLSIDLACHGRPNFPRYQTT